MLTVNDPWAKGVERTNGQDRNVTTNVVDDGQESTEKVEKTGLGTVRAARGEAHLVFRGQAVATGIRFGRASLGHHTAAGGGPLQEADRWSCRPLEAREFRFRQGRRRGRVHPRLGSQRPA